MVGGDKRGEEMSGGCRAADLRVLNQETEDENG
jgi:hypothetical protein